LYHRILTALDGSKASELAMRASLSLASLDKDSSITGCHVCSSELHKARFSDMETGLPESYHGEEIKRLRSVHGELIKSGLQLVANAYLEPLEKEAKRRGLIFHGVTPEGRNYVEILKMIRDLNIELAILGAHGNGSNGGLGSTAERVLLYSQGRDVLLARDIWDFNRRPIVVGVDGSAASYHALEIAAEIALAIEAEINAVSVYDPFFHSSIFGNIAPLLPNGGDIEFDIANQEEIHDQIIDVGLEKLYKQSLSKGVNIIKASGIDIISEVLAGKVSNEIQRYAASHAAGLIVVGRHGLHREKESLIGSNALKLARLCAANVLIVSAPEG
jgi:nucleotide-binding universal stress UspA family protein